MNEELVSVCFREECLKCYGRFGGQWFVSSVWVSNWKDMTPTALEKWMSCMFRKCRVDYRISVVEIRNETITYHTWETIGVTDIEQIDYQLDEIPRWCKPLTF